MNLTLSVDEQVLRKARLAARSMGKSVNELVREYLERMGNPHEAEADITELRELSLNSNGHSRGWKFDRDELHERR